MSGAGPRRGDCRLTDAELADALADRALGRATAALAVGALVLAVLALLFLVLADGRFDARSVPQAVLLLLGQVAAMVVAGRCYGALRTLRSQVDEGRAGAGTATARSVLPWLDRLVVGLPLGAVAVSVLLLVTVRPLATAALSCAVSVALVSQLAVVAAAQRPALRRAADARVFPAGYEPPASR